MAQTVTEIADALATKNMAEKPIALFDLDGTLADYDGTMDNEMKLIATPEEIANGTYFPREQETEPHHIKERRRLIKRQPGFWRNLRKFDLGFAVLDLARQAGFSIDILSKAPRTNFQAWSEKVQWCHDNLPMDEGIRVNLVEKKGLFYGRVLVDDYIPYVKDWLTYRPRGLVIMPAHPHNEGFQHPQVIRVGFDIAYQVGPDKVRSLDLAREALLEQARR
jgi:5'(3')-deoxyribonucleotidase